jgi:hypothetical protein
VRIRYYIDRETDEPHIYRHHVVESEVEDVLSRPLEAGAGRDGTRVVLGKTREGRYLRVVYVPEGLPGSMLVITAFEPGPKVVWALRRRLRKRR